MYCSSDTQSIDKKPWPYFVHTGPSEIVAELVAHNAEEALLNALSHPDIRVVEAAARSLKIFYKAHPAQHRSVFQVRLRYSNLSSMS